jgi:hypothetical protein
MLSFSLLLIAILPRLDRPVTERVDLVEVNHDFDDAGRFKLDQVIFYEWTGSRYDVIAWRLMKSPRQLPVRDWENGGYSCLWYDGEVLRSIWAASIRETWTQSDPEVDERAFLPKERRRELKGVDKRTRN